MVCALKKKGFWLLREIKHLSALCLVCHRLGPDMTRDLIRYVVGNKDSRCGISFDSTRCGISQGCSLKTSLSSIRHLSLRACNLIDLDPVLSFSTSSFGGAHLSTIRRVDTFVRRVLVLRDVRTILPRPHDRTHTPTLKKNTRPIPCPETTIHFT